MVRMVYVAVGVASFMNSGMHDAINKCSSKCFRYFTIIPKYMTYFAMELGFCKHGLDVSMAV